MPKKSNDPKKILIVEDEEFLLDMYRMKFEHEGYEILTAMNGKAGIEIAKEEKPDLILLDLVMPAMSGFEVLDNLKADPLTKDIKVIIFSNLGQDDEIKRGLEKGAIDYLVKANTTPSQIFNCVEKELLKNKATAKKIKKPDKKISKEMAYKEHNGRHILLIEDDHDIADMYRMRLLKEGYKVNLARNGAWGLKFARETKVDVIIMDMVMPAMDGYKMLTEIKKDEKNHKTPVIVLSNSAQDNDVEKALRLGAAKFFLKSGITPAKLIKAIDELLDA